MTEITRRPRITANYDDATTTVILSCPKEWPDEIRIPFDASLNPVARRLAMMGLANYLVSRARGADRRAEINELLRELVEKGMDAFPVPGDTAKNLKPRRSRGPSLRAREQALAALLNVPLDTLRAKLKEKSDVERNELLNHERVLAKCEELAKNAESLEL